MFRVFYSWQSDLPSNSNRGLILGALERACEEIASDDQIGVEPVVDRDTLDVPGAPNIGETILAKIRGAGAFVADVSLINPTRSPECRPTPNPNVLIELGYAIGHLGHERIVLVFNTKFGKVEDLPFDLRQHRTLTYRADPEDEKKAPTRNDLQDRLVPAIRAIASRDQPIDKGSTPTLAGSTPAQLIQFVRQLVKENDAPAWRRLNASRHEVVAKSAGVWRQKYDARWRGSVPVAELEAAFDEFLIPLEPLLATAIVGAESGRKPFADSGAALKDIIAPEPWDRGGLVVAANAPRCAAFAAHHLLGAASVVGGFPAMAASLCIVKIRERNSTETHSIISQSDLVAYPDTLEGDCNKGWNYLLKIGDKMPWLAEIFGSADQWKSAVTAYSFILCIVNLALYSKNHPGSLPVPPTDPTSMADVPPLFLLSEAPVRERAFHLAFPDASAVEMVASSVGADPARLRANWRSWMKGYVFPWAAQGRVGGSRQLWRFETFYPGDLP